MSSNATGNILITEERTGQQLVLLGRDPDRLDIGVAFNAYEKAKSSAFMLEGLSSTPFADSDRDDQTERLFETLVDFAVHCRRYVELIGDEELGTTELSEKSENSEFSHALNRVIHAMNFIPEFLKADAGTVSRDRDTLLVGARMRTDERPSLRVEFKDLTRAFLDHTPNKLWEKLSEHETHDSKRIADILRRETER